MTSCEQETKWEGLARGNVTAATINKFMVVMRMLDQKAQVMILLNSLLVPLCMNGLENPAYANAAIISIITSILSILAAMICIYPKRRYRKTGDRELNLLHFNDIGHMDKQDYLDQVMPKFNDTRQLTELAIHDLYDMSRYSIIPKFTWLKISYAAFAVGNILAIIVATSSL